MWAVHNDPCRQDGMEGRRGEEGRGEDGVGKREREEKKNNSVVENLADIAYTR